MINKNALTGIVMLETMWATRGKDLLDLISPFIHYAVAKQTSPGEVINVTNVHNVVSDEFGYHDMPKSVIIKALSRNPSIFKKTNGSFYFIKEIDSEVQKIEKRREECEQKISAIGADLSSYLENHVKRKKKITADEAVSFLQAFFSRHGLYVGIDRLEEQSISPREQEIDYYIAQYIFENRKQNTTEFTYVIDLVKGYYLQSAIYLQVENYNIVTANYSNVMFYYDTPLLLRLLGWRTKEDQESAIELHTTLRKRKGKFAFFPQTQHEVNNILNAYQYSIGRPSVITLEQLDEQGYSSTDVDRLRQTWETSLQTRYDIYPVPLPAYRENSDGAVDHNLVIDEKELRNYLLQSIHWHNQDALDADIASALAIHRIRGCIVSPDLENCGSVFVTTNNALARQFNKYYRDQIDKNTFPLLISDTDLSAITWIKSGGKSDLPEKQLLRNAYMAMQPTPEMLEKFGQVLNKMEGEGKITPEIIAVLKTSRYVKKEILFSTFDGGEGITENIVSSAMKKITEEIAQEMRQGLNKEAENAKHKRIAHADDVARAESIEICDRLLKWLRRIVFMIGLVVVAAAVWGTVNSWGSLALTIPFGCFAILSILSMIDTAKGREKYVDKLLVRFTNHCRTRIFEKRKTKYRTMAEYDSFEEEH